MLVRWLASARRLDEAEAALATVGVTVPGELDEPGALVARMGLAEAYDAAGRFQQAVRAWEAVAEDCERVLGAEHLCTLTSRSNLAIAYQKAGDTEKAVSLCGAVLEDTVRVLGPDHPATLTVRSNLEFLRRQTAGAGGDGAPERSGTFCAQGNILYRM